MAEHARNSHFECMNRQSRRARYLPKINLNSHSEIYLKPSFTVKCQKTQTKTKKKKNIVALVAFQLQCVWNVRREQIK